jgi:putative ATPase
MRPRTLSEFLGQQHILAPGRLLRRAIEADQVTSIILSGPPGTGKTTLARVIADRTRSQFLSVNAVLSGVKELRAAIEQARDFRDRENRRTILFVDEVHRWNRSQQDALLPWVEEGLIILIGATTENPFFEVNRALLSRSRVFLLKPLSPEDLSHVLDAALGDPHRGYGAHKVFITEEARRHLIQSASGDARTLLNALELAVETSGDSFPPPAGSTVTIDLEVAEDSIQRRAVLYDKDGDYHFDTISALIKSIRGSDPDAALYWLARMVTAGEDPHYIFRRILIQASEDIGLADPQAIVVVNGCAAAFDRVGLPEGQFHLAQAVLYLANAPKSNSTLGYFDALAEVQSIDADEVPNHLRDASRDGESLGHGKGYLYPHAYRDHWVAQQYLPGSLQGHHFYQPGELGWEGERKGLLADHRRLQLAAAEESTKGDTPAWSVAPRRGDTDRWTYRAEGQLLTQVRDLRDAVIAALEIHPTDRVLLSGDGVLPMIWETLRQAHGGLTAAWVPPRVAEVLRYSLGSRTESVDAPQIIEATDLLDLPGGDGVFTGPFEGILIRSFVPVDPVALTTAYLPLLTPEGVLVVAEVEPRRGTRPSELLAPLGLGEAALRALERAEEDATPEREGAWQQAVAAHPDANGREVAIATIDAEVDRRVDTTHLAGWLAPDSPLGAALRGTAPSAEVEEIIAVAGQWQSATVPWRRAHRVVTIRPDVT